MLEPLALFPTELLGASGCPTMAGNLITTFSAGRHLAHVSLKKDMRRRSFLA